MPLSGLIKLVLNELRGGIERSCSTVPLGVIRCSYLVLFIITTDSKWWNTLKQIKFPRKYFPYFLPVKLKVGFVAIGVNDIICQLHLLDINTLSPDRWKMILKTLISIDIFANISCAFSVKVYWNRCLLSRANIASGNGLLPTGNKPLPEPINRVR